MLELPLTLQQAYAAASALFFITAARHAVCPDATVVGLLLGVGTTQMGVPLILGHVLLTWYLTGWFTPDMDSVTTTLYALCIVCYAVILIDMVLCHWRTIIPQPRFEARPSTPPFRKDLTSHRLCAHCQLLRRD